MPIVRFSAAEQGGILLPQQPYVRPEAADEFLRALISSGCLRTELGPGAMEDITPPDQTDPDGRLLSTQNRYFVSTPLSPEIPRSATVHIVAKDAAATGQDAVRATRELAPAALLDINGKTNLQPSGQIEIPQRTRLFPIVFPIGEGPDLQLPPEDPDHSYAILVGEAGPSRLERGGADMLVYEVVAHIGAEALRQSAPSARMWAAPAA